MRYDLISPRPKKDGGTHWQQVGVAFEAKGGGYQLIFNALPLPDAEGRVAVMMREHRRREERDASGRPEQPDRAQSGGGFDDDIPFAPEWRA